VRRPDGDSEAASDMGNVTVTVAESAAAMSLSQESGRSARSCKGKRYQEFLEDGRINAPGSRKRRSHRSGEESEEEAAVNLSLGGSGGGEEQANNHHYLLVQQPPHPYHHRNSSGAALNLATSDHMPGQPQEDPLAQNHWKKKLRTAASLSGGKALANGVGGSSAASEEHQHRGVKRGYQASRSLTSPCGNNLAFDGRYLYLSLRL